MTNPKVRLIFILLMSISSPANAEFRELEKIGPWTLFEDKDESFGALGYQVSSETNGDRIQVTCEISQKKFTYQTTIVSDNFNFSLDDTGGTVPRAIAFELSWR